MIVQRFLVCLLARFHQFRHLDGQFFDFFSRALQSSISFRSRAKRSSIVRRRSAQSSVTTGSIAPPPYTRVREDTATQEVISLSSASWTSLLTWILLTVCFLGAN